MFAALRPLVEGADLAVCHEEVPFAAPGAPYENYPVFSVAGGRADLAAGLRGDDDPDLADARGRHRLDAVEQHRLVGDGDQLLRRRVGDRAQTRPFAARKDQAFELLNSGRRLARHLPSPVTT